MRGSVLILGADRKRRLDKAWEVLTAHGFDKESSSPDFLSIGRESDKKSLGIARARGIRDFLRERPFEKRVKAVLVEEAGLFTDDAQNSLLKILEEPPVFGLLILLSDKEGSLLPTVVSRCQKVTLDSAVLPADSSQFRLSTLTFEEMFDAAKDISANGKEEALEYLEQVLRVDLQEGVSQVVVQKTEQALKDLREANVALKFALEYLFLLHAKL